MNSKILASNSNIYSDLNQKRTSIEIEQSNELEVNSIVQTCLNQIRTSISTTNLVNLVDKNENENENEIQIEFQNEFNNEEVEIELEEEDEEVKERDFRAEEEEVIEKVVEDDDDDDDVQEIIELPIPLGKSEILSREQSIDLIRLCEFDPTKKWTLIYRGTRDGFKARYFHFKCDGHSPTLTILKAQYTGYICGGYTEASWESPPNGGYKYKFDANAFLFSLSNLDNKPCIMKTRDASKSIGCSSTFGPRFGAFGDLHVADNANGTFNSFADLGDTYAHDEYVCGSDQAKSFLAGAKYFQLSEIEVFKTE